MSAAARKAGRAQRAALASPTLDPTVEVSCTVCGAPHHTVVASAREIAAQQRYLRLFHRQRVRTASAEALREKATFTHDYATNVVACTGCDVLYRDPRPPARDIAAAYATEEYGEERLEQIFASQLELYRPKAGALARRLPRGRQPLIIEIGSFVGGFLAAARERGLRAVGIDPGREVTAFCERKGLEVVAPTPEQCDLSGAADCITIWNTFDQLPRPQATIDAARRLLRPGGLLLLRVPNGACFRAAMAALREGSSHRRRWLAAAMAWNNLLAFPYLHGYSLPSLDRLLAGYGLRRTSFAPDVLTRLADAETKWWASAEEQLVKRAWQIAWLRSPPDLAPWIDVSYRLEK